MPKSCCISRCRAGGVWVEALAAAAQQALDRQCLEKSPTGRAGPRIIVSPAVTIAPLLWWRWWWLSGLMCRFPHLPPLAACSTLLSPTAGQGKGRCTLCLSPAFLSLPVPLPASSPAEQGYLRAPCFIHRQLAATCSLLPARVPCSPGGPGSATQKGWQGRCACWSPH